MRSLQRRLDHLQAGAVVGTLAFGLGAVILRQPLFLVGVFAVFIWGAIALYRLRCPQCARHLLSMGASTEVTLLNLNRPGIPGGPIR